MSEPATCGATSKPAHGGSKAGPLLCGSGPALEIEATSVVMCELVSAVVVLVLRVFGTDPVGVTSVPGVVAPWRVLMTTVQRVRKKLSGRDLGKTGHCEPVKLSYNWF